MPPATVSNIRNIPRHRHWTDNEPSTLVRSILKSSWVPGPILRRFEPQIRETWRRLEGIGGFVAGTYGPTSHGICTFWKSTPSSREMSRMMTVDWSPGFRTPLFPTALGGSTELAEQRWFAPRDLSRLRMARVPERVGFHRASSGDLGYLLFPTNQDPPWDLDVLVAECAYGDRKDDLIHLSLGLRGTVVTRAEALEDGDFGLEAIDEEYRRLGLRRYRRAWVAYSKRRRKPVGAVIAYRGPVGVDPDLLENRCELMIHPDLAPSDAVATALRLLHAAGPEYEGVFPGMVPTLAEVRISRWLASKSGARPRALAHLTLLPEALAELRDEAGEGSAPSLSRRAG